MVQEGGKTLTRLTQNFKRMLPGTRGGEGGENSGELERGVQDSSAPQRSGLGRLKARFLKKQQHGTVDIPPSSFDYESSMGFPEVVTLVPSLLTTDSWTMRLNHRKFPGSNFIVLLVWGRCRGLALGSWSPSHQETLRPVVAGHRRLHATQSIIAHLALPRYACQWQGHKHAVAELPCPCPPQVLTSNLSGVTGASA